MNVRWTFPFCLLGAVACGDPGPGVHRAEGLPITHGTPDTSPAHMAVVAVHNSYSSCSGTLVAPRVVLTAGHCAILQQPEDFLVFFGTQTDGAITRTVSELEVHPDFAEGDELAPSVHDVAVLLLDSGAPPGVRPIPHLPHGLGVTDADIGRPLTFVGFGEDEFGDSGVKLKVVNNLDIVCTTPGGCPIGGYRASENTLCQDQMPGGPCSGDSGGPALITRGEEEYVAGVTSYGLENCLNFGCSTKADEYDTFIDAFALGRLGSACVHGSACRSGVCEDGVCCEAACEGSCQACDVPGAVGSCRTALDGTPCLDGDLCNGDEVCLGGACTDGVALVCSDDNPCTIDGCDAATGCGFPPVAEGAPCDNDDLCDGRETCGAGVCRPGEVPDCDDGKPCTLGWCNRTDGCVYEALPEGTPCAGRCGDSTCSDGVCASADTCNDGNPCTTDSCNLATGCEHRPATNGISCGDCLVCESSRCVGDPACAADAGCGCGHDRPGVRDGAPERGPSCGAMLLLVLPFLPRRSPRCDPPESSSSPPRA